MIVSAPPAAKVREVTAVRKNAEVPMVSSEAGSSRAPPSEEQSLKASSPLMVSPLPPAKVSELTAVL
jgi:hypothetical protein